MSALSRMFSVDMIRLLSSFSNCDLMNSVFTILGTSHKTEDLPCSFTIDKDKMQRARVLPVFGGETMLYILLSAFRAEKIWFWICVKKENEKLTLIEYWID